ncbi:hypothetical protein [Jonesia quinghaiensis]|uniref:hypothetical protein n=1 Tax=Jonesia quinghaiensis TaxID=262806 RepID=UPI00048BB77E|nr:hypothetical protein [Jonesia quinghaiensis]
MTTEQGWIVGLFIVGSVAQGAALIVAVLSIMRSVDAARKRPAISEDLNARFQARRKEVIEPLEEAMRGTVAERREEIRVAKERAENQVSKEFACEFNRHGMVPNTYNNEKRQHYTESVWQMKSTLRPQVWSAGLLVVGIVFETWASIWAIFIIV